MTNKPLLKIISDRPESQQTDWIESSISHLMLEEWSNALDWWSGIIFHFKCSIYCLFSGKNIEYLKVPERSFSAPFLISFLGMVKSKHIRNYGQITVLFKWLRLPLDSSQLLTRICAKDYNCKSCLAFWFSFQVMVIEP